MSRAVLAALRHNMWRALAEGRLEDAGAILIRLKQEDPTSLETRGFELELYLNLGRLDEADALAGQLCRLFPGSARVLSLAGKVAYKRRVYDQAAAHFRESQRVFASSRTQYWLGKTLTQAGQFDEAESLLLGVRGQIDAALLELGWLYERKNDFEAALAVYQEYLSGHPGHAYASAQSVKLKARLLDPDSLIEEVAALKEMGEELPAALFPEFVDKLFQSGHTTRARDEVMTRIDALAPNMALQVGWICYRRRAYDIASTIFLKHLRPNLGYYKFLNALESAAAKCNRLADVLAAYRSLANEAPHLHGRCKAVSRRVASMKRKS